MQVYQNFVVPLLNATDVQKSIADKSVRAVSRLSVFQV